MHAHNFILYIFLLQTNTFQCVLATTKLESFVIFLYADGKIQWTTGDASGGSNGLGGTEALAGINAGDGINFTTIPGSLNSSIINITQTSNIGIPGVWIFKVGEGKYTYIHIIMCVNYVRYKPATSSMTHASEPRSERV